MPSLSGSVTVNFNLNYVVADSTFGNASKAISYVANNVLSSGTGNNAADQIVCVTYSLSTGGTNVDVAGGLTDVFGNTITMVELMGLLVVNKSTTSGENVLVGGAAANQLAGLFSATNDVLVVKPSGLALILAPLDGAYAVTAGTGDILKLASATGTPSADVIYLGRSA